LNFIIIYKKEYNVQEKFISILNKNTQFCTLLIISFLRCDELLWRVWFLQCLSIGLSFTKLWMYCLFVYSKCDHLYSILWYM